MQKIFTQKAKTLSAMSLCHYKLAKTSTDSQFSNGRIVSVRHNTRGEVTFDGSQKSSSCKESTRRKETRRKETRGEEKVICA
ncbi:MAG TPA: hypothetical protein VMB21_08065 [Candidatus Limnocylindria bacterium]|nr:hypothetical protein [Candidatus Limnocylindria bacterium]